VSGTFETAMVHSAFAPPVFDALRLADASLDITTAQRLGVRAIRKRQASRLHTLLDAARSQTRFWRERLPDRLPANDERLDLGMLPVLTKAQLMARFDDAVAQPEVTLAKVREFISDPARVGEAFLGRYIVWESSGTSGESGIFVQDAPTMAVLDALEALRRHTLRPMRRLFDPLYLSERLVFVDATGSHFASVVSVERLRRLNPWMGMAYPARYDHRPTIEIVAGGAARRSGARGCAADQARRDLDRRRDARRRRPPPRRSHLRLPRAQQLRRIRIPVDRLGVRARRDAREHRLVHPRAGGRTDAAGCARRRLAHDAADEPRGHLQPLIHYDLGDRLRVLPGACATLAAAGDRGPGPAGRSARLARCARRQRQLAATRPLDPARGRVRRVRLSVAPAG
jgi:hypothetical protein